jgi:RNA polymerase sigma factor (sigma-70 family)
MGHLPQANVVNEFKEKIVNRAKSNKMSYENVVEKALSIPRRAFLDVHRPDFGAAVAEFDEEALDRTAALQRVHKILGGEIYEIFCLHFIDCHTLDEIAKRFGLTAGRISQIISESKEALQKQKRYIVNGDSPREKRGI